MKIAIINSVAGVSSKELAFHLKSGGASVDVFKPFKEKRYDYFDYDLVFNYGCSARISSRAIINKPVAVEACVDKPTSFQAFQRAGVDTVEYATRLDDVPAHWDWLVVREQRDGRKAEGLNYYENIPGEIPDGQLFTEYYEHRYEYRVVIFNGEVVGYYYKNRKPDGWWHFMVQPQRGFDKMGEQCVRAAKELGIDYVGFDVVAKDKNNFRILEANSSPIITAESKAAIYSFVYK